MGFFVPQGKSFARATHGKLHGVLGEAVVSLATVKRWFQPLKGGNFFLHNENKPGCRLSAVVEVRSQFLIDGIVLSADILAKGLAPKLGTQTKRFL
jgi:hypothetical protein